MSDVTSDDATTYAVGGAGVVWRETAGEVVVLDVTGSVYFGVNASGAGLWRRLLDGASRRDLGTTLSAATGIDQTRADSDVDTFLTQLRAAGLLQERIAGTPREGG